MKKPISIVHLYPADMNMYGDHGNIIALTQRLRCAGYEPNVTGINPGDHLPHEIDIVIGGGGPDSSQQSVAHDLHRHSRQLHDLAQANTPMLVICGMYQLFGHRFVTRSGQELPGIGVLDVETHGSHQRMVGNIIVRSTDFGDIIGYENHSGHTTLGTKTLPLGTCDIGMGNHPNARTEGARNNAVIGSYLHGALLPKNPAISDYLISTAIWNRYSEIVEMCFDDSLALQARATALSCPR